MDTVNKGLLRLPFRHFTDKFSHRTVGQQHKLFDQFIGIFRFLDICTDRLSGLIDLEPYFKAVEIDGSVLETFIPQFLSQSVQYQYFIFIVTFSCLDHQLCLFIRKAAVAFDHGTSDMRFLYIRIVIQFKDSRET